MARRIEWMRDELGVNYIMCWMNMGGLDRERVLRSMRLFADEVMPRFRDSTETGTGAMSKEKDV